MCGKTRFILSSVSALMLLSFAPANAESLNESVAFALKYHPSVVGAKASRDAASQAKSVEKSNYLPQLSLDAAAGRTYQDNSTSRGLVSTRGAAYSGYGEANIALRQMMFDGMETAHRVRAAHARVKSRDYSLLDMQEQITLRTAESYIEILRLRAAIDLLDKHTENIKDYEARITDMVVEGVSDETDRQQARDVSMVMESLRADYEGQILSARAAFEEAVGSLPPSEMFAPVSLRAYINDDIAKAVEDAKQSHPLLQGAKLDSQAARHDMKAVNADFYPDVSGELSYSKLDKKDVIGGESKDARALVRMSWDISLGGKEVAAMRQKKFEHYEVKAKSAELERRIERDIRQSYAAHKTYERKFQLAKDRVDLNKKLLDAYKVQFEGARINLLQLMKAESQAFNALLEESDNSYYLLSSEHGVLASLGKLHETLFSVDDLLQETEQGK